MRYVFLDVDGVLNSCSTKEYLGIFIGIDPKKLEIFNELMTVLYDKYGRDNVKIILSSSWRYNSIYKTTEEQNTNGIDFRGELDKALKEYNLFIDDITPKISGRERGNEILTFLATKNDIEGYIVLDDDVFMDFKQLKITKHLVQTSFYHGALEKSHIKQALLLIDKSLIKEEISLINERKLND